MRLEKTWKKARNLNEILNYQSLLYFFEVYQIEPVDFYHDNLLAKHFGIQKVQNLITKKYLGTLWRQMRSYIKSYDVCLASKAIKNEYYWDLQASLIHIHCGKNVIINFLTRFSKSLGEKSDNYDSMLVNVNQLKKMIQYK